MKLLQICQNRDIKYLKFVNCIKICQNIRDPVCCSIKKLMLRLNMLNLNINNCQSKHLSSIHDQ